MAIAAAPAVKASLDDDALWNDVVEMCLCLLLLLSLWPNKLLLFLNLLLFSVIIDVVVVEDEVVLLVAVGANVADIVVVAAVVVDVGISIASVLGCRLWVLRLLWLW